MTELEEKDRKSALGEYSTDIVSDDLLGKHIFCFKLLGFRIWIRFREVARSGYRIS